MDMALTPDFIGEQLVDWLYGNTSPPEKWQIHIQGRMVVQDIKLYRTLILHKSISDDFQPKDERGMLSASDSMLGSLFAAANNMLDNIESSTAYLSVVKELLAEHKDKYTTLDCDEKQIFDKLKRLKKDALKKMISDYTFVVFEVSNTKYLSFNAINKRLSIDNMPCKTEMEYSVLKEMICYERECIIRNDDHVAFSLIARYPINCLREVNHRQKNRNGVLFEKIGALLTPNQTVQQQKIKLKV